MIDGCIICQVDTVAIKHNFRSEFMDEVSCMKEPAKHPKRAQNVKRLSILVVIRVMLCYSILMSG